MYFQFACSVQRSLFSPNIGAYGTETIKVNLFKESKFTKNAPLNTPLVFTFQKSFYSQWGFNIPAHQSAANSKHMGHGLKLKLKLKLKQCHGLHHHKAMNEERWQIMQKDGKKNVLHSSPLLTAE